MKAMANKSIGPPIIIIGAGRSGTNMLRDTLSSFEGLGTWPCDEINYIWRYGNARFPTDEFSPDLASPHVSEYIRKSFEKIAVRYGFTRVIEKTCANSLRVSFVHKIFPDAKYIHIVRDGRDVSVSASARWTAKLDIPYILKKARFVPVKDIPYYALKYFLNRIYRIFSTGERLASWGPRYNGMEKVIKSHTLHAACAIQWQKCVKNCIRDFSFIDPDNVITVRYEDFVGQPSRELKLITEFLGLSIPDDVIHRAVENISDKSVGRWKTLLSDKEKKNINSIINSELKKYGYLPQ